MSDLLVETPHDDLEAYALGALDPEDEARFDDHLRSCGRCREGLATYVPITHALRQIPQALPPPLPTQVRVPAAARRSFPVLPFGYAVAASLLLVIGGGLYRIMQPSSDAVLMNVAGMMADGPRQVALAGPGVRGRVIVGRRAHRTAVILRGLAAAPAGQAYHVWVEGQNPRMIGSLEPARNNLEVLIVDGNQLADSGVRSVAVNLEGAQALAAPSGATVASGTVQ